MTQRYACVPFIIDENLVVHDSHHLMAPCTKGNWVRYQDYDALVEKLDLANRRLGELAHAPMCVCHETSTRNCSVHQNGGEG